ncbi:uncharacterized protein LOC133202878 [Saccostrea echinata]|uniref:uncharacterized protein LOC133202878 n=1 Tax=Saccostrea echinata TaxID=191078 RepID=UPI002A836E3D|nr:uncharacterized protein LOC133202878 [Saccostrea echinata]
MAASKVKYPLGSPQEHIPMCEAHSLPLHLICEDCDEFICAVCAKIAHKDHDWNPLSTSASQIRKGLSQLFRRIKEDELPRIDAKMEKMLKQIAKNEKRHECEIKRLQKHWNELMSRLAEIKERQEQTLKDNLSKKNGQVNLVQSQLLRKKNGIVDIMEFMEENNRAMSDLSLVTNHKELTQLLSDNVGDINNCEQSVRYSKGNISDDLLESIAGKTLDIDDVSVTETSSFNYGDERIVLLKAFSDDLCYIRKLKSEYIEEINKQGEKMEKHNIYPTDICVTDKDEIYFTDFTDNSIRFLSPEGSVSTVVRTLPLSPGGICQCLGGGFLVTLRDTETELYKLESHSRNLLRHISWTGDVISEYEFHGDGQTRLFTLPVRVSQSSNTDICVVNWTSTSKGEVIILSSSGSQKSVYRGQNLAADFRPTDVASDLHCNVLLTDHYNNCVHLLSPEGKFLMYLMTEKEGKFPYRLSLYKSTLWVGNHKGLVRIYQYKV